MPLAPNARLGPYEILGPLGAGGMGEVYRARDTRLGREVAVKVLPPGLTGNAEVRARFEREARTVSSLNHPHICVLHDVGREGDIDFLVMELVQGETLAQRLTRGPLPPAEVIRTGTQVADALDRAHKAGVIHRDLKPGNIMLTKSGAKLMDFGLARATGLAAAAAGPSGLSAAFTQTPTMAAPLTAEGTIVGTFQYMAPEQLEGEETDARSDIWALGCVLYEMATGRRAFEGKSQASLISAIMSGEPAPIAQLAPLAPPLLERVVKQCLAKDPDDRWQSAGDLKRALEFGSDPGASSTGAAATAAPDRGAALRRARAVQIVCAVAGAVFATGLWLAWLAFAPHGPRATSAAVLDLPTAPGARLNPEPADLAISPDGRMLAYVGNDSSGVGHLWLRSLDSPSARMIPETDRAWHPFWSPDSRWIAYFTNGDGASLIKVPVQGGAPVKLADAQWGRGGSWGKHGDILFVPAPGGPVMRVSENGGTVTAATMLDTTLHETSHRHPSFLADGEHFVYVALPAASPQGWTLYLASLHSRAVQRLGPAMSAATWVEPGFLLYDREGRFVAQRLDLGRRALVGDVIPLANSTPRTFEDATRVATCSSGGRIAMLRMDPPVNHLQWFDRSGVSGRRVPIPSAEYVSPILSHDGRRVAISRAIGRFAAQTLRVDLDRDLITALTDVRDYNFASCWSPDDRTLGLSSIQGGGHEEVAVMPAGGGPLRRLTTSEAQFKSPQAWSPDGRTLVILQIVPGTARDLFTIDAERGGTPQPLVVAPGDQLGCEISPDGQWLVYDSEETGRLELFVCRFPDGSDKLQLTTAGGAEPQWTRQGREIVYRGRDGHSFYALPFVPGRAPGPNDAQRLFSLPFDATFAWTVTKDGQRFLILEPDATVHEPSTTIIVDWQALAGRR